MDELSDGQLVLLSHKLSDFFLASGSGTRDKLKLLTVPRSLDPSVSRRCITS